MTPLSVEVGDISPESLRDAKTVHREEQDESIGPWTVR